MDSASRTLVKSPPELWELIDQPDRMQGLMCALIGRATEVTVSEREPESVLRWEASDEGADAWIEVHLAEKGWGTNVKLRAENNDEPTRLEGWLDAVLEELATPQKRPFENMSESPAGTLAEAIVAKPAKTQEPQPEPEAAPQPEPEPQEPEQEPAAEEPETPSFVPPQPDPPMPGRIRRFFGLD
jgi:hypothetical protein